MDTPVVKLFIYIHRISTVIIAVIHRIGKSFAQTVGIEPTRRGFGDLTDTLSVTCILLLKFKTIYCSNLRFLKNTRPDLPDSTCRSAFVT
jgi:hypothetical protein